MKSAIVRGLLGILLLSGSLSFAAKRELDIAGNKFGLTGKCMYHERKIQGKGGEVYKFVTCNNSTIPSFSGVSSYLNSSGNMTEDPFYIGQTEPDAHGNVIYVFFHPSEVSSRDGSTKPLLLNE